MKFTPQQALESVYNGQLEIMESDSEPEAEPTFDMMDDSEEYEEYSEYSDETSEDEAESDMDDDYHEVRAR